MSLRTVGFLLKQAWVAAFLAQPSPGPMEALLHAGEDWGWPLFIEAHFCHLPWEVPSSPPPLITQSLLCRA